MWSRRLEKVAEGWCEGLSTFDVKTRVIGCFAHRTVGCKDRRHHHSVSHGALASWSLAALTPHSAYGPAGGPSFYRSVVNRIVSRRSIASIVILPTPTMCLLYRRYALPRMGCPLLPSGRSQVELISPRNRRRPPDLPGRVSHRASRHVGGSMVGQPDEHVALARGRCQRSLWDRWGIVKHDTLIPRSRPDPYFSTARRLADRELLAQCGLAGSGSIHRRAAGEAVARWCQAQACSMIVPSSG